MRITRKVDATGPDFGCKFRLRRSPGASKSVFGPVTAPFLSIFYFFSFFCVAYLWRSLNTARFSDDSHFFVVTLSGGFCKNAFFHFFDEKCALRTYSVSMAFGDFRTQNYFFPLFFFLTLSGDFYKNAFFHFFDEESVLVTCGVLCPCYRGKTRSGPSGAHRSNQRAV